ncbi:MAG: methyltransferase domain-containing protein [Candidatus Coatesbacteria bacterium]|nr:methyltransferase domain-containing protein [Candidatus Coatesbacteria bacterium]
MLRRFLRKFACKRYRDAAELITPVQASATALPFVNGAFGALYLVCALYEIQDRDAALAEFRRVLRRGVLLAVVEFLPDPDYRCAARHGALSSPGGSPTR